MSPCIPAPTDRRKGPRLPSLTRLAGGVTAPPAEDPRDTGISFPHGHRWAVTEENVREWNAHQFAHWFEDNPAMAHALGALDDHPVYLLRLDIQAYYRLFRQWERSAHLAEGSGFRVDCFRMSREEYVAGLTRYLRRERESWGRGNA